MSKTVHCSVCNCDVFFSNIGRHNKTKRHLDKLSNVPQNEVKEAPKSHQMTGPPPMEDLLKQTQSDDVPLLRKAGDANHLLKEKDETKREREGSQGNRRFPARRGSRGTIGSLDETEESDIESVFTLHSEGFLKDMENDVFGIDEKEENQPNLVAELKELRQKNAVAREQAKLKAFQEKEAKQILKHTNKNQPASASNDTDEPVEETQILGKERRILLAKICMYKDLFKKELKNTKFRIKQNATTQELNSILEEMQTIVSVNGMEAFTMDIIMGSLKIVEGVSSFSTNFDITGLADALKDNEEFTKLVKLLFIKYQTFATTPPEYRLIFIVLVNCVVMTRINKAKKIKS